MRTSTTFAARSSVGAHRDDVRLAPRSGPPRPGSPRRAPRPPRAFAWPPPPGARPARISSGSSTAIASLARVRAREASTCSIQASATWGSTVTGTGRKLTHKCRKPPRALRTIGAMGHLLRAGICEDDDELRGVLRDALERDGLRGPGGGVRRRRGRGVRGRRARRAGAGHGPARRRRARRVPGAAGPRGHRAGAVPHRARRAPRPAERLPRRRRRLPDQAVRAGGAAGAGPGAGAPRPGGRGRGPTALPARSCWIPERTRSSATAPRAAHPTEFRLLAALSAKPGAGLRRRALVAAGWPDGAIVHNNTLDAYLARIRRKLRDAGAPATIETMRGVGYRLRRDLPAAPDAHLDGDPRHRPRRAAGGGQRGAGRARARRALHTAGRAGPGADRRAERHAPGRHGPGDRQRRGARPRSPGSSAGAGWWSARPVPRPPSTARRPRSGAPGAAPSGAGPDDVHLRAEPVFARGVPRPVGAVVVALSAEPLENLQKEILLGSLVIAGFVLVAGLFAISGAVSGALRPVARMTASAEDWGEHDLDRRFDLGPARDELTGLAATLDGLLARIAASRRHEQRFASEVAHELRTPVAGLRGRAELALSATGPGGRRGAPGRAARRRSGMRSASTRRWTRCSRSRAVSSTPRPDRWIWSRLARELDDVDVTAPAGLPAAEGEPELVRRALAPLVDNARRHARSRVSVELSASGGRVRARGARRRCRARLRAGGARLRPRRARRRRVRGRRGARATAGAAHRPLVRWRRGGRSRPRGVLRARAPRRRQSHVVRQSQGGLRAWCENDAEPPPSNAAHPGRR